MGTDEPSGLNPPLVGFEIAAKHFFLHQPSANGKRIQNGPASAAKWGSEDWIQTIIDFVTNVEILTLCS
jgi:hypothetical protein